MSQDMKSPELATRRAREAQQGDRSAFEWLVRRYRNLVASIAYSHIGDFGRSEDIAQQTFLTAWERLATLQDVDTVAGWLAGIARNLARNEARRTHRQSDYQASGTVGETASVEYQDQTLEEPEVVAMRKEQQELLWQMLEKLPVHYREPLVLFYREGNSVADVAEQLELKPDAVKQRLARGRNMLRVELMDVLEETLRETEPSETFVGNVMAALPIGSVVAGSGTAAVTKGVQFLFAKKLLGGTLMTGAIGGIIGGLIGAMGGLLGAYWGTAQSLKAATSPQEKKEIKRFIWLVLALVSVFVAAQLYFVSFRSWGNSGLWIVVSSLAYCIPLFGLILYYNKRVSAIKAEYGTAEEREAKGFVQGADFDAKPATPLGFRVNSIAALGGSSTWLLVLAAINSDIAGILSTCTILGIGIVAIWVQAPRLKTASSQQKANAKVMLPVTLANALLVGLRWDSWTLLSFGTGWASEGWLVAAAVAALGVVITAFIWRIACTLEKC